MKNKVLVKLLVPEIDMHYDVYLPINKKIGNIINLLNEAVVELSNGEFMSSYQNSLINGITNENYMPDKQLIETDIRNGTVLILLS